MNIDNSVAPLMPLIQYYDSRIMMTALRLGVFDQLADEPQTSADFALRNNLNEYACDALLKLLVGKKLLTLNNDLFGVTDLVRKNICGEDANLAPLKSSFLTWSKFWDHLEEGIQTGKSVSRAAIGVDPTAVWSSLQNSSEKAKLGMQAIHHRSVRSASNLSDLLPWDEYGTVVDLGAGSGCMLEAIVTKHQNVRGILVDLPETVLQAKNRLKDSKVFENLSFHSADLFDAQTLPRSGDAYLLSWILHDWADSEALLILKNCFEAMPSSSSLIIFENFVENNQAASGALCNLSMSLYFGSKERTVREYVGLLERAGFRDVLLETDGGSRGCLVARKL